MSSRPSVLITGARSGINTVHADCFAMGSSHAVQIGRGRTRTRTAQRRFRLNDQGQAHLEQDFPLEERSRERTRIVQELHDTLFQGFVGASMLLDHAVEQTPADSPSKPELSRALRLIHRALDEGRAAIRGFNTAPAAPLSLDQAFSKLLEDVTPSPAIQLQLFVQGEPWTLNPTIQEQVFMIGREAVMNSLRHSEATKIEVEVHYLCDSIIVCVHDNGCGINSDNTQKERDSHWGLRGMCYRAENIDAELDIWSRPGEGTEVRVAVAKPTSQDCSAC